MATGIGLNMESMGPGVGYGAIEGRVDADAARGTRSRSSRRADEDRTSGPKTRRHRRPSLSRSRNATGPRQRSRSTGRDRPSTFATGIAPRDADGIRMSSKGARRASRRASARPHAMARSAPGQATRDGASLTSSEAAADTPSAPSAQTSTRDARHSNRPATVSAGGRKRADELDEGIERRIGRAGGSHHPVPERVVFGVEKL